MEREGGAGGGERVRALRKLGSLALALALARTRTRTPTPTPTPTLTLALCLTLTLNLDLALLTLTLPHRTLPHRTLHLPLTLSRQPVSVAPGAERGAATNRPPAGRRCGHPEAGHISPVSPLYLHASPYISLGRHPEARRTRRPVSPCISLYLPVSPYISPGAAIPKLAALVAATIGALQLALPLSLPLALHP